MLNNKTEILTLYRLNKEEKNKLLEKYIKVTPCVCACDDFAVVLKSNGKVEFVGTEKCIFADLTEWHGLKKLCAGKHHIVGLKLDGSVVAVGRNEYGQCDVISWKNISDVYAKYNCTYGITEDGKTLFTGQLEYDIFSEENFLNSLSRAIKEKTFENDERMNLFSQILVGIQNRQKEIVEEQEKIKSYVEFLSEKITKSFYKTENSNNGLPDKSKLRLENNEK